MVKQKKVVDKKRTQLDYSISFKIQVVQEIEHMELSVTGAERKYGIQGRITILNWLRKHGKFDW
jgi:transposase-like protein